MLVYIINALTYTSTPLIDCVREAQNYVQGMYGDRAYWSQLQELINSAVRLAANNERDIDNIRTLGEGWVAEETLVIALYCAIKYEHDFSKALCAAVNHDGDSDSTGAVTGNILGAIWGYKRIPQQWKDHLECKDLILEIADDLYAGYEGVSREKVERYL
ncbi:ADP-ribosylglycohydrolase family protein [Bifidobacterium magnum]|uniref:ADP-ribosylglycohydrolase family protein n=1 Tax=Bifidobacterium magnum TaxID=1692 RepID=UPI0019552C1F|nr:ADP-ribosylglycohydrolase family protein [Bifidobacterium magnum]